MATHDVCAQPSDHHQAQGSDSCWQVGEESWRVKRSLTQSFRSHLAQGGSLGSQRLVSEAWQAQLSRAAGHSQSGSGAASRAGSQTGSFVNSRAGSKRNSLDVSRPVWSCESAPAEHL